MASDKKQRLPAYRGEQPYIFVSYAHKNAARVLAVVSELTKRQYRVWYDEGIEVGADWPEVIASRLAAAAHVIVFRSAESDRSQNCAREINYAVSLGKSIACVRLDASEGDGGAELQLSVVPTADAGGKTAAAICDEMEHLGCLTEACKGDGIEGYGQRGGRVQKRLNKWTVAAAVFAVLFLASAAAALGLSQGWFSVGIQTSTAGYEETETGEQVKISVTAWSDPVSRDLLLSGMERRSLFICGNAFVTAASAIRWHDGAWYVGEQAVKRGDYTDFSAAAADETTELALAYQQITDLSPAAELQKLTYLDISGNEITDLSPLKSLPNLKALRILHIDGPDLSVLSEFPALRYVYISADMVDKARGSLNERFDVIIKE